jgi:Mg2+/citrate symporter
MEALKKALANLIKIKSLVTIAVITVFVTLSLNGRISADNAMIIISMVVSFYFGMQTEKKGGASNGS